MLSRNGMAFCGFSRHTMYDESLDASRCFGLFLRRGQVVNSSQLFGSNSKLWSFRFHDAHLEQRISVIFHRDHEDVRQLVEVMLHESSETIHYEFTLCGSLASFRACSRAVCFVFFSSSLVYSCCSLR
jgi:hypothetical protein